jgi:hypothetical protein
VLILALPAAVAAAPPAQPVPAQEPEPRRAPGLWTRATTVAYLPGRWIDARRYQQLQQSQEADDIFACFAAEEAQVLLALALQTGVEILLEAKSKPRQPIPIADKNLLLVFDAIPMKLKDGRQFYRPVYMLRVSRLPQQPSGLPNVPHGIGLPPIH